MVVYRLKVDLEAIGSDLKLEKNGLELVLMGAHALVLLSDHSL